MVEIMSFNFLGFTEQKFSFPSKVITIFIKNASANVMQNFYRTCKHFYKEAPYFIVDTLVIEDNFFRIENEKYDCCITGTDIDLYLNRINNIWVIKNIEVERNNNYEVSHNFYKVVRCDAYKVSISQPLTIKNFEILTKSGKVENINCMRVVYPDESRVSLEDLMAFVPNACKIVISGCSITPQTMTKILAIPGSNPAIPWKQKLRNLNVACYNGSLDVDLFYKFVKNNFRPDAYVKIHFSDTDELREFIDAYNAKVKKSAEKLPYILSVYYKQRFVINNKNIQRQKFPFNFLLIQYIRDNASANVFKKFHQTCKYFYQKNHYCIIDNINSNIECIERIDNDKIFVKNDSYIYSIENIWVTNELRIDDKKILEKIVRCDASKIILWLDELSINELKLLTRSKKVKKWYSDNTNVYGIDGNLITLEELLLHLPNVKKISAKIKFLKFHSRNESLQLSNKIEDLSLNLQEKIDVGLFYDFIKAALAPKATIELSFFNNLFYIDDDEGNENHSEEEIDLKKIKEEIKEMLNEWKPKVNRPSFR